LVNGDVILDSNGECWRVGPTTSGPASVTYSSYYGFDACGDCIGERGCNWYVDCCVEGPDPKVVNDFGYTLTPGDVVLCGDGICRTVISIFIGPANDTIMAQYRSCQECFRAGGNPCK
jgi:hypothetical protein